MKNERKPGFPALFSAALLPVANLTLFGTLTIYLGNPDEFDAGYGALLTIYLAAAFPIAAILLTRLLGLARFYVPLVVATNWAAVIQIAVFIAAVVLARLLGEGAGALLMLAVTILLVAYQWFVIRTALDTTGANAFGLLAVDLLLSAIVNVLTDAWATAG